MSLRHRATTIVGVSYCLPGHPVDTGFMDPVVVQCVQRGDDHQRDERPHHFFGSGTDNRPDAVDKGDKGHQ